MRISLLRSIAASPAASAQDAALAVSVLSAGLLLAIEFDLFHFAHELSVEEQRISLLEAIALTLLLALCIGAFILRRVREEQIEGERRAEIDVAMRELRDQAMHDELTALPNRRAMFARLRELDAQGDGRQHAFFLLDLDGFKRVNDEHGHAAGDNVLLVVAERFKRVTRPSDLLARIGGDEFAVLAHDVDYQGAKAAGERLIAALDNEIWVDGSGHQIGVSIGVVLIPQDCVAMEAILGDADIAMYRAKAANGSAVVFYCDLDQLGGANTA